MTNPIRVVSKTMMENCLCSPELKDWLLTFAGKCIDIGYTQGVDAVFTERLKDAKAEEFPFYEDENMNYEMFVDGQVAELQSGILEFGFLNYLEANYGLPVQENVNVFRYAYPNLEQEAIANPGGTPLEDVVGRVQDARPSETKDVQTIDQIAPKIPIEPSVRLEGQEEGVQKKVHPLDQDPGNVGEV